MKEWKFLDAGCGTGDLLQVVTIMGGKVCFSAYIIDMFSILLQAYGIDFWEVVSQSRNKSGLYAGNLEYLQYEDIIECVGDVDFFYSNVGTSEGTIFILTMLSSFLCSYVGCS